MYLKDPNIHLVKLKGILGYRDMRSVIDWCEKNGVFILRQGNRQVVNSAEFILSYYRPFINHLKGKHQDWKGCFMNYLEGNIRKLMPEVMVIGTEIISSGGVRGSAPLLGSVKSKNTAFLNMLKNL